jgi:ABC-type glutathione transport system ATPase component
MGATDRVFGNPQHSYTRTLLESVPQLHNKWERAEAPAAAAAAGPAAERSVSAPLTGRADGPAATLLEVEDGHFVVPESPGGAPEPLDLHGGPAPASAHRDDDTLEARRRASRGALRTRRR